MNYDWAIVFLWSMQMLAFAITPIDKDRYQAEMKENFTRKGETSKFKHPAISVDAKNVNWFWIVKNPREMSGLIKRYHMVGNGFILFFFVHLIALAHLTLKSIYHGYFSSQTKESLLFYDSIYYPNLGAIYPIPSLINNLILIVSSLNLAIRIRSAYRLIRSSIINAHIYKEISITQINVVSLSLFSSFSISDWFRFFKQSIKHKKEVKNNLKIKRKHYQHLNSPAMNEEAMYKYSLPDKLHYVNMLSWCECFDNQAYLAKIKQPQRYSRWFIPTPNLRFSPIVLQLCFIITIVGYSTLFSALFAALADLVYMELSVVFNKSNREQSDTWYGEVFELIRHSLLHFAKPINMLRLLELTTVVLFQVPFQFDSCTMIIDGIIIVSRINRIIDKYQLNLNAHRAYIISFYNNYSRFKYVNLKASTDLIFARETMHATKNSYTSQSSDNGQSLQCPSSGDINKSAKARRSLRFVKFCKDSENEEFKINFNRQVCYNTKLVHLIYMEFLSLKKHSTSYLNILFIGSGFCIAYTMSIFFAITTTAEMLIVLIALLSCLWPTASNLVFCANVEQKVS